MYEPTGPTLPHVHPNESAHPATLDHGGLDPLESTDGTPHESFADEDELPSALTLLETDETSSVCIPRLAPGSDLEAERELNLEFRHSGWRNRRAATLGLFGRMNVDQKRVERFCNCGSLSWVLQSTTNPGTYRIACNRCRDRWCEPCAHDRRLIVARNLREFTREKTVRFLTLTIKSSDDALSVQIDRIIKCFARFRGLKAIRPCMTGGVYFLEISRNEKSGQWHPHIHCLFEGSYLPKPQAVTSWLQVTKDSYILDIRQVRNSGEVAGYIAKYAAKAISPHVWTHPEAFAEAIRCIESRRTFNCFGSWRGLELSKNPEPTEGWEPLMSLGLLLLRVQQGHQESIEILKSLRKGGSHGTFECTTDPPT